MPRKLLTPQEQRLLGMGLIDPDGELTGRGERVAEERHFASTWAMEDVDPRFSAMGPDTMPDTNVVGP